MNQIKLLSNLIQEAYTVPKYSFWQKTKIFLYHVVYGRSDLLASVIQELINADEEKRRLQIELRKQLQINYFTDHSYKLMLEYMRKQHTPEAKQILRNCFVKEY